jgi:hypothetical protein
LSFQSAKLQVHNKGDRKLLSEISRIKELAEPGVWSKAPNQQEAGQTHAKAQALMQEKHG